jgi:hypothetical protein
MGRENKNSTPLATAERSVDNFFMIIAMSCLIAVLVGGAWGWRRRRRLRQDPYFPKFESVYLALLVASLLSAMLERVFLSPVQVLNIGDLVVASFPFAIIVTIVMMFPLSSSRFRLFRERGLVSHKWKAYLAAPFLAFFLTFPALEVLNRATDLSREQEIETVVRSLVDNPVQSFFMSGGLCTAIVRNPFQDSESWRIRLNPSDCNKIHVGITPLQMTVQDGRLGIPYLTALRLPPNSFPETK